MGDAYYLQPPKTQQFYRLLATCMTFIAVGDRTWWGYESVKFKKFFSGNRLLVYAVAPSLFISQAVYLYVNYRDLPFNVKGILFAIIPVAMYVTLIVYSTKYLKSYKKSMNDFMDKIHLCNYPNQDCFVKMRRIQIEKMTRFVTFFMVSFLIMDSFAWCAVTGFNSYKSKDFIHNQTIRLETVIYVIVPFDYEYNFTNWCFVHTLNVYLVFLGVSIIIAHHCVNYAMVLQLIGHIDVLKHKIKTEFKGKINEEEVKQQLVNVIKYHSFVLKIFREIQSAFGLNVSGYYAYNLITDSSLLCQLMIGNNSGQIIIYGPMIIGYGGGLVLISFVLEEIRRQSDDISDLVYDIDWESMSTGNRKMVVLLLMRVQPALTFTAFGGLRAGVNPMISIIKTSFSLYVLMKQSMKTSI